MALTPADIHNTEFAKASLGRRGYDENDVDMLLDEATGEMIRLLEENNALREELEAGASVGDQGERRRSAQAELSAETAALEHAQQARDNAERLARQVRERLDEALRSVTAATVRGTAAPERVLAMARDTADGYVREAEERSRVLLAEARHQADRTLHGARDMVAAIDRTSLERRNEAAAGLASLARDADELGRFAVEYHSALGRHLRRQALLIGGTAVR